MANTQKAYGIPKYWPVFEHMSEFDPEGARLAQDKAWKEAADAAGVSPVKLIQAKARVVANGYYGPIADTEWCETTGTKMTTSEACRIVELALSVDHEPVRYEHPDVGYLCEGADTCMHPDHTDLEEPGPLFHCEVITIESDQIKKCMWRDLIHIYGGIPAKL